MLFNTAYVASFGNNCPGHCGGQRVYLDDLSIGATPDHSHSVVSTRHEPLAIIGKSHKPHPVGVPQENLHQSKAHVSFLVCKFLGFELRVSWAEVKLTSLGFLCVLCEGLRGLCVKGVGHLQRKHPTVSRSQAHVEW